MGKQIEFYCGLTPYLSCKDYLVSGESYEVMICDQYDMLVTSPVPVDPEYYYKDDAYISHTDSKKTLFDRVYQTIKTISTKRKFKLINKFGTKKNILDIGAGTGDFLAYFKTQGWEVSGVEPSEGARLLSAKKEIILHEHINAIAKHKYDVITMWHVLEHIPNLSEHIRLLEEMLTDDGILIVAVPNFKSYDAKHYGEYWAAYDVPRHLWHFSQSAIERLFSEVGISVVEKHPLIFDAYYVSLLSEQNKSGNKNILQAFINGWRSNSKARRTSEYSSIIYVLKKQTNAI